MANYRESFIDQCQNDDRVCVPPPAMMEDLKKNLIEEFDGTEFKDTAPQIAIPGYMNVYLKVRPFSKEELEGNENQGCFQDRGNNTVAMHAPKDSKTFKNVAHGQGKSTHSFTFSQVFNESTTQKVFFDQCTLPIVQDFINGQNCLVFTYGVTSAGKTFTLLGTPDNAGILPRSLDVVFNSISNRRLKNSNLMPRMFREVVAMTPRTAELQQRIKDKVMEMATNDEPNMSALLGTEAECSAYLDSRRVSASFSLDSLNSMQYKDSLIYHQSLFSIDEVNVVDFRSMERTEQMLTEADTRVREQTRLSVSLSQELKFAVWVAFAEIYNENIYDLLDPLPTKKNERRAVLRLKEDDKGIPFIKGLKWIQVADGDEAFKILTIGRRNLQVACTKFNKNSSRSHCVFTMKIIRCADITQPHMARVNMLSFVDLAGSERYSKTQSVGSQLREAAHINTSLLTLGRCLDTLRFNQHHKVSQKMVPFRESRLTRLFQSFFTGEGKAAMIVNINQNASMFDETLHALKFSAIAKQVTVVQKPEPEKKPPPKRASVQAKKSPMTRPVRDSVPWGSPRALQRYMEMEEAENITLEPEYDVEDLLATIDDLTARLKAEKLQAAFMEVKIREEVSEEMSKYLVKIENDFSERMEETRAFQEDRADQRIELYINTVKRRKRPRNDSDENTTSETAPDNGNKELLTKIDELDDELAEARNDMAKALSERDSMREELSKVQFELSGLKQLTMQTDNTISDTELIDDLGRKLEETQEQVREQTEQIVELNELLTEAGQTFHDKDLETERLKAAILDAEGQLKEQTGTIFELRKMVVELRDTIEQMELKVKQSANDGVLNPDQNLSVVNQFDETMNFELRERMIHLEEVVAEKKTVVTCLEEAQSSLISQKHELERTNQELMTKLELSTRDISRFAEEKSQLAMELNAAQEQVHELERKKEAEVKLRSLDKKSSLIKRIAVEKETLTKLTKDQEIAKKELSECEKSLKHNRNELRALVKQKTTAQGELEKVRCEVCEKQRALDDLVTQITISRQNYDQLMKKTVATKEKLGSFENLVKSQKLQVEMENELQSLRVNCELMNSKVEQRDAEIGDLRRKLELKNSVNQNFYDKMCQLEEELHVTTQELEKSEENMEELMMEKKALEDMAQQLSNQAVETDQRVRIMSDKIREQEERLQEGEGDKSQYTGRVNSLEKDLAVVSEEKALLEAEVEKLSSRMGELYAMLKVANDAEMKLKTEKHDRCAKFIELEASMEEKSSRIIELDAQLKLKSSRITELEVLLEEKSDRIIELEGSLEELDAALSQECQAKSRLDDECTTLRKQAVNRAEQVCCHDVFSQTDRVLFMSEEKEMELITAVKRKESLQRRLDVSELNMTEFRDQLTSETQNIQKGLEEEVVAAVRDRDMLKEQLADVQRELEAAVNKCADLQNTHAENSQLLNERAEKIVAVEEQLKEQDKEFGIKIKRICDLESELQIKCEELREKELESAMYSEEITKIERILIEKSDANVVESEKLSERISEKAALCNELEQKLVELSKALEKADMNVIDAVQCRDRAEEQNAALDQELQNLRNEYATLLAKYSGEVEMFEKDGKELREQIEKLSSQGSETMADLMRIITEQNEENAKKSRDSEMQAQLCISSQERIETLSSHVEVLTKHCTEMSNEREKYTSLVRSLFVTASTDDAAITKWQLKTKRIVDFCEAQQLLLSTARDEKDQLKLEARELIARMGVMSASIEQQSKKADIMQSTNSEDCQRLLEARRENGALRKELSDAQKKLEECETIIERLKVGLAEADEAANLEEEDRKEYENQITALKKQLSMSAVKRGIDGRDSRSRLWTKSNSGDDWTSNTDVVHHKREKEDAENIDPNWKADEVLLAERAVQVELLTPSPPVASGCQDMESSLRVRVKPLFVSPTTPSLPAPVTRSSARKTKSSVKAQAYNQQETENRSKSRKRCLMKVDKLLDASPDSSLDCQALLDQTADDTPLEATIRGRLRTRRK